LLSPLVEQIDPKTMLILSTTVGEIEFVERGILEGDTAGTLHARPAFLLDRVKKLIGLTGPAMTLSSACASSSAALTRAASLIKHGDVERVLVVACDSVSEFVYSGFSTLMSLCEGPAKPFDAERTGLTLGEAAAWALVTRDDAPEVGDDAIALLGWGNTTDAIHMTAPDRSAGGLARAIGKACDMAGRSASEISFVAAHGTATVYSDAMEMVAFRDAIKTPKPVFSIKGGIGHTLAAAGLVQILVAGRALKTGDVPPTVGLSNPDPAAEGWARTDAVRVDTPRLALSTNSGFGGVNTALLLALLSHLASPGIDDHRLYRSPVSVM
jgi:3-oxoacyl-[acyl-carrier-protein] synthase II